MNEITQKLLDKAKDDMSFFITGLHKSGYTTREIAAKIKTQVEIKTREFYARQEAQEIKIASFIGLSMKNITNVFEKGGDSKAERIFYKILEDNKIPFDFQYKIGPYRADYLIAKTIIFEGDGQQHRDNKKYDAKRDKYLSDMGYIIMRVEWSVVAMSPEAVIEEIQNKIKCLR